jgi:hypothetical protein
VSGHQTPAGGPASAGAADGGGSAAGGPVIQVVGPATAEEVAALVAVLSAASGSGDGGSGDRGNGRHDRTWGTRQRLLTRAWPPPHGPGGWRASARPH